MPFVPTFVPPVDALNRGHDTLWGNLGEWSRASGYVEAAGALALHLGTVAGLGPGQRVVDVGSGAGDQLRLWTDTFRVRQVTALERDPALAERARRRVAEWGLAERIRVVPIGASASHWTDGPVDRVLALDAAYFFDSRSAFLQRCRSVLRPGGVLALTDLLLGDGPSARIARGVAPFFGVRRENLLPEARYRELMDTHDFDEIRIRDHTDDVLGGFARWTRAGGHLESGGAPGPAPLGAARIALSMTGRAAGFLARSSGLRYVVVTARRGGP